MRNLTGAEFLAALEAGTLCTPTDKDYKVYIGGDKFYFESFSEDEARAFQSLLHAGKVKCNLPGYFQAGIWLPQIHTFIAPTDTSLTRPSK